MNMTYERLKHEGLLDEFAKVFDNHELVERIIHSEELGHAGLKDGGLPLLQNRAPSEYWAEVTRKLANGLVVGGLDPLLAAAARLYPGNKRFAAVVDYEMEQPIFLEGPDQQRFQIDDLRAATRIRDIGRELMGTYENGFWPTGKTPVVDLRTPAGETRRLQPDQTVHEAGVRAQDTLCVYPERTAGSVNPFLRDESLTMVRNQILDFAKQRPDLRVDANSTEVPTEYLIHFTAPGFAPPAEQGGDPVRADRHEVLLVMPPDFPVGAPQAYWQNPLFHPNIHERTGCVCLGVLAESYRPGLHFGVLCQMLIDMASYRNYELTHGLNPEAIEWAVSDSGRKAIQWIGGRSPEEMHGLQDQAPGRHLKLRRIDS